MYVFYVLTVLLLIVLIATLNAFSLQANSESLLLCDCVHIGEILETKKKDDAKKRKQFSELKAQMECEMKVFGLILVFIV